MRYLFIIGTIIFANSIYCMDGFDRSGSFLPKGDNDVKPSGALRLLNIDFNHAEYDEEFSDTSSSTVEVDALLPVSNFNIDEMVRHEISPDIGSVTSIKVDYAKLDGSFADKLDAKNWKPPLIPFGGGSEVSENQSENVDDGNWLNFLF